ncbi:MAG TPA: type IV pilus assembly protein PilM [Verrucomicrobiae bacterium]|jgi:type IV pilus assembly protein PilM|nr:type IV pilus assembly protein PilM [Verrucomicrobiae bacterium]
MLQTKSFLAVDFGAGSLKLAEFEVNEAGGLRLKQYGTKSLGQEGAQENTREATILKALQALISEMGIKSKDCNVCAPGFHVFSKFVKLPPVEQSKVTQIIQYEAQQNVPFPLSEVVWDYQILGQAAGGELEVLLVAIKSEIVEGLFRVADAAGLKLQVADVSPAALCNAFRFNYGDLEDCTMLLDIGAKTSNLLFFERGKVYSRSINLGANSITQDFAAESKMKWDVAEKIKIEEGFVSLGGAYEEPENPNQAAIAKIARQFMTRLHIQVNQTMQFYRGQQGGSQPARLFLSGGASIMPYTAQFFAEKLNVPVEYFNPFRNVQIDPAVNLEELVRVAHSMGEVVGLGLRNLAHCPVELNLMPESTRKWRDFNEKKPFLIATVFTMVVVVAVIGLLFQQLGSVKAAKYEKIKPTLDEAQRRDNEFNQANQALSQATGELSQLTSLVGDRYYWMEALPEFRRVLMHVEEVTSNKWGSASGIWIEQFVAPSVEPSATSEGYTATPSAFGGAVEQAIETKYGLASADTQTVQPMAAAALPGSGVSTVTMVCRSRKGADASANSALMYALLDELRGSPLVDPKGVQLGSRPGDDDSPYTFTFAVKVTLKNPLKL